MDEQTKKLIADAKEGAEAILKQERLNADAAKAIQALLIVADLAQGMTANQAGQSADSRLLKRKFDQLKTESLQEKKSFETFKKKIIETMVSEFKTINTHIQGILQRHPESEDPDKKAAEEIRSSTHRIVTTLKG